MLANLSEMWRWIIIGLILVPFELLFVIWAGKHLRKKDDAE